MTIRPEIPSDTAAISAVHHLAFGTPGEARLVELVRGSKGFVPELSLVAEESGQLIGHVLLSLVTLESDDGASLVVLALAPLAVVPERQRDGVGSALVRRAVRDAEPLGRPLVVVLGHPRFYPRFGFEPASRLGIRPPFDVPDEAFMALALPAYQTQMRGAIRYPPAFDVV